MCGSKVLAKCNLDITFSSMVEMKSGQRCGGVTRFATSTKRFGGETLFFSIHKSEQRFILGLLRTLQPLLWTYGFLPMFVQGSCFSSWLSLCLSFFLHKKNMAEVHPYQKRWTCFENFGTWKNMGVFFSQLFWSPKLFFWLFSWVVRDLWCQSASGQRDQVMIERFIGKCNQKMEDHVRLGLDFMSE